MIDCPIRQAAVGCRWASYSALWGGVSRRQAWRSPLKTLNRSKATLATAASLQHLQQAQHLHRTKVPSLQVSATQPLTRGVPLPVQNRIGMASRYVLIFLFEFGLELRELVEAWTSSKLVSFHCLCQLSALFAPSINFNQQVHMPLHPSAVHCCCAPPSIPPTAPHRQKFPQTQTPPQPGSYDGRLSALQPSYVIFAS